MKETPLLLLNRSRVYHSLSIFATQPTKLHCGYLQDTQYLAGNPLPLSPGEGRDENRMKELISILRSRSELYASVAKEVKRDRWCRKVYNLRHERIKIMGLNVGKGISVLKKAKVEGAPSKLSLFEARLQAASL
jgi:hypothetical protein